MTDPVDELWHCGVLGVPQDPAGVAGEGAGHPAWHRASHCLHRGVQNLGSRRCLLTGLADISECPEKAPIGLLLVEGVYSSSAFTIK